VTQTAPQELRDNRQQDVEEFYELYIEYLFGESSEYDEATCLMDDIRAPDGASDHEQRKFAVTLMNRLLFIKFLEKKDVVPRGTLIDRVNAYEESGDQFAGTSTRHKSNRCSTVCSTSSATSGNPNTKRDGSMRFRT